MPNSRKNRIGILTGGGDCPGLNAVIRGVAKVSMQRYGMEVLGVVDGFEGLILRKVNPLKWEDVSGILTQGGTILGTTNRADPFKWSVEFDNGKYKNVDVSDKVMEYIEELELDALVCIGGDGTMTIANQLNQKGIHVVGVPKTIDNDILGTDITFGFNTAVATASEAVDKLNSTAMSHHRVMIVEVMGRDAGWIALETGIATGSDVVLIPEIPYDLNSVCEKVSERSRKGHQFSIVVVAEGAKPKDGERVIKRVVQGSPEPVRLGGIGSKLAHDIEELTGLECRVTVLGHLLRGGTPSAFDRVLATRFGVKAAELCCQGVTGVMVAVRGNEIINVPLSEVGGKNRFVCVDDRLIDVARSVGTCFGE